jgi:tol-pal system protein YbgF
MWNRYALVILLFSLSACAEFSQSIESVGPASAPKKGEAFLKQQIVNAQEQNARLEVRVSKFERKISSLNNDIHGLELHQIRLEENLDKLGGKVAALASSISSSSVSRVRRSPSPKKEAATGKAIRQALKQASKKKPRKAEASPSNPPARTPTAIVPKAPVSFIKSSISPKVKRSSLSPQEAYSRAYRSIREKKNKKAILQFREFLRQFPKSRLAANAQYWLGESYYDMRNFPTSLKEFQKVISRYPGSRKVPDALYKKGVTYLSLKNSGKATRAFKTLIKRYPKHPLTEKARNWLLALNNRGNAKRR